MTETNLRIYSATTGECLIRDSSSVDEAERERVHWDFVNGVRLTIDPPNGVVRGFVPAARTAPEAFYAVVSMNQSDIGNAECPIQTFATTVASVFDSREHWSLRVDTPEGRVLTTAVSPATGQERGLSSEELDRVLAAYTQSEQSILTTPDLPTAVDAVKTAHDVDPTAVQRRVTAIGSVTGPPRSEWDVVLSPGHEQPGVHHERTDTAQNDSPSPTHGRFQVVPRIARWWRSIWKD